MFWTTAVSDVGIEATVPKLLAAVRLERVGFELDIRKARHAGDHTKGTFRYLEQIIVVVGVALHPETIASVRHERHR